MNEIKKPEDYKVSMICLIMDYPQAYNLDEEAHCIG